MRVLICGGGVIGASIAYFLSRRGAEASSSSARASPAPRRASRAASWRSTGATAARSRRWRGAALRCTPSWPRRSAATGAIAGSTPMAARAQRTAPTRGARRARHRLAVGRRARSTAASARPRPRRRCIPALHRGHDARGGGAGRASCGRAGHRHRARAAGRVTGVEVDGETIEGDAVVIAMGPWSILAARWLPLPPVFGLKGHSLVFETGTQGAGRGAVPRIPGGGRRGAVARGVSARRRHHLCLRHLQREPAAGRSRPTWRPIPAPSSGCRRCAAGCRRCSARRRCSPRRPAFVR